jgi:hypothetical protein
MPKPVRPAPRGRRSSRRKTVPAVQAGTQALRLIDRLLDTPQLPLVVPRLPPEVVHQMIEACGLEDCGALLAHVTPVQLTRIFDADLWRSPEPGADERFDPDRVGVWLEVLMESGAEAAAAKVAGLDPDVVVAALSRLARVFDGAAASAFITLDGDVVEPSCGAPAHQVGGYALDPIAGRDLGTLLDLLRLLHDGHREYFHGVMRRCVGLSNEGYERDGLDDLLTDRDQDAFDLLVTREGRREQQGFVAPGQAAAFLKGARALRTGGAAPPRDPIAAAYVHQVDGSGPADPPERPEPRLLEGRSADGGAPAPVDAAASIASFVEVLRESGVLPEGPRALLTGADDPASPVPLLQARLEQVMARDPIAHAKRLDELVYLANTLAAGCPVQGRPFTPREASDAAAAICNLGIERWPAEWFPPGNRDGFLAHQDLVGVFQVGWRALFHDVCMHTTARLLETLSDCTGGDTDTAIGLATLRADLARQWRAGTPWLAAESLEVIMILDGPLWMALGGLIAECPVLHAAIAGSRRGAAARIDAGAFEFISTAGHVASIHQFLETTLDSLRHAGG